MSEAGVEDRTASFDERAKAAEDVKRVADTFCRQTGLRPSRVWPVAGALVYSEYGFVTRLVMRMIAKHTHHGATDSSRDYEYTDWQALDRFVAELVEEIEHTPRRA
jgi:menaquinone-dependent protoporphyrinogen oxidase